MSAIAVLPRTRWPVVVILAVKEARWLVLHPATIVGWGLLAVMFMIGALLDRSAIVAFDQVTTGPTFYPGLFCVLAGHMVATRDHRAGAAEMLGSVPATREQRVLALTIAAWIPAVIALALNIAIRGYFVWQDVYVEAPGTAHVLQGPVTVLGGALLGITLGLWLPQRVVPVLAMVVLVVGAIVLANDESRGAYFAPLVSWVDWGPYDGKKWYAVEPGNPGAHVIYLAGLSGLAAIGAWMRVGTHRLLAIAIAIAFLAAAVWGGVTQLP